MFTLFAIAFFLIGVTLLGLGVVGRVRRAHLRAGAPAAALHRRRGARGGRRRRTRQLPPAAGPELLAPLPQTERVPGSAGVSPARAVVFAYHDVGVRCLKTLLSAGVEVPLVVTVRG